MDKVIQKGHRSSHPDLYDTLMNEERLPLLIPFKPRNPSSIQDLSKSVL